MVISGDVDRAIEKYLEAKNIYPNLEVSAFFWNQLCWFGSIYNRASDVLFACEKAVNSEPTNRHLDTRGLALSLVGRLDAAIADFEIVIKSGYFEGEKLEKRKRWLKALKSGINPFTPEELEALRASEGATS